MATILPFPVKKMLPTWGLTEDECDAVQVEAYDLVLLGRVTGVSSHGDGQCMCGFDGIGEPYFIGRENGVCYLSDNSETMFTRSQCFEIVLIALEMMLPTTLDLPV